MRVVIAYIIASLFVFVSCGDNASRNQHDNKSKDLKESLEKANRALICDEESDINNYIRHHVGKSSALAWIRYQ